MSAHRHLVLFSGGVASWAAARRVLEATGAPPTLLFTDTRTEDEDTYRFLRAAAADVGGELVWLTEGRTIWEVFRDERMLGNTRADPCSRVLKRAPARRWVEEHLDPASSTVYLGLTWDESHRLDRARPYWSPYRVEAPLVEAPYLMKPDLVAQAERAGLPLPDLYRLGFPHANCGGGCVKAGAAHFAHLLRVLPERFAEWEREEEAMRQHLERDVAILRDRRGGTTRPLTLRELRQRVEAEDQDDQLTLDWGGCGCMVDP